MREHVERMAILESTQGSFLSLGSDTDPFEDERTRQERQAIVTDIISGHIHGQHGVSPNAPTQMESQRELHSQLMSQQGLSFSQKLQDAQAKAADREDGTAADSSQ